MNPARVERLLLLRPLVRLEVFVAERPEPRRDAAVGRLRGLLRLPVLLDERHDVNAGRELDEALLEPQQEIPDVGRLRLGFLLRDRAEREIPLLALEAEIHLETPGAESDPGHPYNLPALAMFAVKTRSKAKEPTKKGLTPFDVSPFPARCRREDLNLHGRS